MKRGISPLIATVLIIGLTVALSGVIITWGSSMIKAMEEATAKSAEHSMTCVDATFEIKEAHTYGSTLNVVIESTGKKKISNFMVRVTGAAGSDTVRTTSGIEPWAINPVIVNYNPEKVGSVSVKYNMGETGLARKVEMFPILIDQFGDEFDCLKEVTRAAAAQLDESVMAAYVMDDGYVDPTPPATPNHVLDLNGIAPAGTIDGAVWDPDGGYDGTGAFSFDGVDDKIIIPGSSFNFDQGFTITTWAKRLLVTDNQVILDNGKFKLEIKSAGGDKFKSWFTITDNQDSFYQLTSGSYSNPINNWVFLAIVYDGDKASPGLKMYINKDTQVREDEFTLPIGRTFDANSSAVYIGAPASGGVYLNGLVDEIIIYNKVLASNEIEFPPA